MKHSHVAIAMGGKRESNMELLRIIAMFLVMMIHTTQTIHYPEFDGKEVTQAEFLFVSFLRAISFVAVNVFVLLSGWFSIKYSLKGLLKLLYQVLFFSILCYGFSILCGIQTFSIRQLLLEGFLVGIDNYWFVQSYVVLFLLSPLLNSFCDNADKRTFKKVLSTYFCVIFAGAWMTQSLSGEFEAGLSTVFFIGLYILARYIRIYTPSFANKTLRFDALIFLSISALITIIALLTQGGSFVISNIFTYTCPLIVVSSVYLLLAFSKMKFQSKLINTIASSCFAVYLLHEHVSICNPLYRAMIRDLYYAETPYTYKWLDVVVFMLIVYIAAVFIDKIRYLSYKKIIKISKI